MKIVPLIVSKIYNRYQQIMNRWKCYDFPGQEHTTKTIYWRGEFKRILYSTITQFIFDLCSTYEGIMTFGPDDQDWILNQLNVAITKLDELEESEKHTQPITV